MREILAVLLLGILALAAVVAMGYYIFIGHNWNVAASHIDDSIGQMDGYAVVLYQGTRPLEAESGNEEGSQVATKGASSGQGEAAGEGQPSASGESDANSQASSARQSRNSLATASSSADASQAASLTATDMAAIKESYREKGAVVFMADVADLARYDEPFVVAKNGVRIGFLSAGRATLRSAIRADVRYLREQNVNYVIALTNDTALCNAASDGLVGDISIIICDDPEGRFPNGRYYGSTYCVSAPSVDQAGAVIMPPSGVLSCKTMDGLQDS